MEPTNYLFSFDDLSESGSCVQITAQHSGKVWEVPLWVDDSQFSYLLFRQMPTLYADLIDLAVAIHVVDRLALGRRDLPRRLHVQLPLRHPDLFRRDPILEMLRDILHWYTDDVWDFTFTARQSIGRLAERQACLNIGEFISTEVALWSGGLDSLAGVVNRISAETAEHYLLFGSGSNSQVHATQKSLAAALSPLQQQRISCLQVIYRYKAEKTPRNRSQRARGFVFMLLGAVCALLADQRKLHIYENGVGAINLAFRASEVGLDHTRAVHPISLTMMTEFVSELLDMPFHFVNPFVFWTKADMSYILKDHRYHPLVAQTISCDRIHRTTPRQCGICSSCLLRKQGLRAADVTDETGYLYPSARTEDRYRALTGNHLRAMLWQVQVLKELLATDDPWNSLVRSFPRLVDIIDRATDSEGQSPKDIQDQFVQMYRRYVREWEQVRPNIQRGLLEEEEVREAV
jgi:7-cyano-7-deazaguanine synthase in queuosine biosynthesis